MAIRGMVAAVIFLVMAMFIWCYMPDAYSAVAWAIGAVVVVVVIYFRARKGG